MKKIALYFVGLAALLLTSCGPTSTSAKTNGSQDGFAGRHEHISNGIKYSILENSPATCTEKGHIKYETECKICNERFVVDEYPEPLNHKWKTSYQWAEDYSSCTATGVCQNDNSHVKSETVASTQVIDVYTSTFEYVATFEDPDFTTQHIEDETMAWYFKCDFDLNPDGQSYSVRVRDRDCDGPLFLPSTYNDLPVTRIPDAGFRGCWSLTSITIPDSVISIGQYAFADCDELTSVSLSNSIESIPEYCFYNCEKLSSIVIPGSAKTIGRNAFEECGGLESVVLSEGVVSIEDDAFSSCQALTKIEIPTTIESVGKFALPFLMPGNEKDGAIFLGNEIQPYTYLLRAKDEMIESCVIPDGCKIIGSSALSGCKSLASLSVPDSVKEIGDYAFKNCVALESVTLPSAIREISKGLFFGCTGLKEIYIPNTVEEIGSYAFNECSKLSFVTIPEGVKVIGDHAFAALRNLQRVVIEGYSALSIGDYAFASLNSSLEVEMPASVTSIGERAFFCAYGPVHVTVRVKDMNDWYAMAGKEYLENVTLVDMNGNPIQEITISPDTSGISKDDLVNAASGKAKVTISSMESWLAFKGKEGFGNWDVYLYNQAGEEITEIFIPEGVTAIGDYAFYRCVHITQVHMPTTLISIGEHAFEGCEQLHNIEIRVGSVGDFVKITGKKYLPAEVHLVDASGNEITEIVVPDGVKEIEEYAFSRCVSLRSIVLPDSLIRFGGCAIKGCDALQYNVLHGVCYLGNASNPYVALIKDTNASLDAYLADIEFEPEWVYDEDLGGYSYEIPGYEIPSGCKFIYDEAFSKSETPLDAFPKGLLSIGNRAFYEYYFGDVELPKGLVSIGEGAFMYSSLTSLSFYDSLEEIGDGAFFSCNSLTKTDIHVSSMERYLSIKGKAYLQGDVHLFDEKSGVEMTWVSVGGNIESLQENDFKNCVSLTSIVIGESIASIDPDAFKGCTSLKGLYFVYDRATLAVNLGLEELSETDLSSRLTRYFGGISLYFYAEQKPAGQGNYWHYVNGVPTAW